MRNSLLPIIAVLLIASAAVLLIRVGEGPGQGGPEVNPGIFRLPKRESRRVQPAPLSAENRVSGAPAAPDGTGWHVVVVGGGDRSPVTQAVMLALAETLTARGAIAVLDPLPAESLGVRPQPLGVPPLPLPADRVLRVATTGGVASKTLGEPFAATVAITAAVPRCPADHPAARLQPDREHVDHVVTIVHHSTIPPADRPSWATWWAGVGHSIGDAALERLAQPAACAVGRQTTWDTIIPQPTQTSVMRWASSFQFDLVRGWVGAIEGLTTNRNGSDEPTIAVVEKLLGAPGSRWQPQKTTDPELLLWAKPVEDGLITSFSARRSATGWDVAHWQERVNSAAIFQGWCEAARAGDDAKRDMLRRHLGASGIPEDFRAAARELLGADLKRAVDALPPPPRP